PSLLRIHPETLVHVAAATAGHSALLISSATAFSIMKYAGAAYLIGIGLITLLSLRSDADIALGGERTLRRVFAQGVVVNVLNPNAALFFLVFLPPFVDPDRRNAKLQIA